MGTFTCCFISILLEFFLKIIYTFLTKEKKIRHYLLKSSTFICALIVREKGPKSGKKKKKKKTRFRAISPRGRFGTNGTPSPHSLLNPLGNTIPWDRNQKEYNHHRPSAPLGRRAQSSVGI